MTVRHRPSSERHAPPSGRSLITWVLIVFTVSVRCCCQPRPARVAQPRSTGATTSSTERVLSVDRVDGGPGNAVAEQPPRHPPVWGHRSSPAIQGSSWTLTIAGHSAVAAGGCIRRHRGSRLESPGASLRPPRQAHGSSGSRHSGDAGTITATLDASRSTRCFKRDPPIPAPRWRTADSIAVDLKRAPRPWASALVRARPATAAAAV